MNGLLKVGILATMLTPLAGCTTATQPIATPTGNVTGIVQGPMVVLGTEARRTSTGKIEDGAEFRVRLSIDVPVGTQVIVPSITGYSVGFGETEPEDINLIDPSAPTYTWKRDDKHFGALQLSVLPVDIDAAAPGATSQTAQFVVLMRLLDGGADDKWWGTISYNLLYLGNAPE